MIPSPVKSGVTGFVILLSRIMEYIQIQRVDGGSSEGKRAFPSPFLGWSSGES